MKFFLLLLHMIPTIIDMVKMIEKAIPDKGKGPEKLNLVLTTIDTAAKASTEAAAAIQGHDLNAAVTAIVGATVSTMNAVGKFQKPVTP